MKVRITAQFDNRDMADFAILRMRRNGLSFEVADLRNKSEGRGRDTSFPGPLVNIIYPYPSMAARSYMGADSTSLIGSRAILSSSGTVSRDFGADYGVSDEAQISISIDESESDRALQALRSSYGYNVKTSRL